MWFEVAWQFAYKCFKANVDRYYLRHGEGLVFIVVRCFVCLSVCLLATLRKNG